MTSISNTFNFFPALTAMPEELEKPKGQTKESIPPEVTRECNYGYQGSEDDDIENESFPEITREGNYGYYGAGEEICSNSDSLTLKSPAPEKISIDRLIEGIDSLIERIKVFENEMRVAENELGPNCDEFRLERPFERASSEGRGIGFIILQTDSSGWLYSDRDILYMPQAEIIKNNPHVRELVKKVRGNRLLKILDKNVELIKSFRE